MLQAVVDGATRLLCSIASVLFVPTVLMLLVRRFVPVLGEAIWRGYCQVLVWLVVGPVRLVQFLFREAVRHRR